MSTIYCLPSYCLWPITYYLLTSAQCLLPTAYCLPENVATRSIFSLIQAGAADKQDPAIFILEIGFIFNLLLSFFREVIFPNRHFSSRYFPFSLQAIFSVLNISYLPLLFLWRILIFFRVILPSAVVRKKVIILFFLLRYFTFDYAGGLSVVTRTW